MNSMTPAPPALTPTPPVSSDAVMQHPAAFYQSPALPVSGGEKRIPTGGYVPPTFSQQPADFLAAILQKIASVDKDGYFQIPVDEKLHQAPNYYAIIKHPLCFRDMKQRLASGMYRSYRQLREDFELICSNAKTFNKSTTKVYKAAGILSQKGTKILKQHELDIRKAFSLLAAGIDYGGPAFSGGLLISTGAERDESCGHGEPSIFADAGKEATSEGLGDLGRGPSSWPSLPISPPRFAEQQTANFDQMGLHQQLGFFETSRSHEAWRRTTTPVCAYISDHEDSPSEQEKEKLPLETVLQNIRTCSVLQLWEQPDRGPRPAALEPEGPQISRTAEWRERSRQVEWQARWLELRMMELKHQKRRIEQQLANIAVEANCESSGQIQLQTKQVDAAIIGEIQQQTDRQQQQPAAVTNACDQNVDVTAHKTVASTSAKDPCTFPFETLRSIPFLQARAGTSALACLNPEGSVNNGTKDEKLAKGSQPTLPLPVLPEEKQLPAMMYATCDMLAQQLQQLRSRLLEVFPSLDMSRLGGKSGLSAAGARHASGRRVSSSRLTSGSGLGGPGLSVLTRMDSSFKRKRSDAELDGLGSPSLRIAVERAPSSAIFIPPVRELRDSEQQARLVAATTWNDEYHVHGESALCEVPPEVEAVMHDDEGSSSEDTSDEAYAHMHKIMEEEEHKRYAAVLAEGQRKRANQTQSKGQQGLQREGHQSLKTPRGQGTAGTPASGAQTPRTSFAGTSQDGGPRTSRGAPFSTMSDSRPLNGRRASELGTQSVKSAKVMDGVSPAGALSHANGGYNGDFGQPGSTAAGRQPWGPGAGGFGSRRVSEGDTLLTAPGGRGPGRRLSEGDTLALRQMSRPGAAGRRDARGSTMRAGRSGSRAIGRAAGKSRISASAGSSEQDGSSSEAESDLEEDDDSGDSSSSRSSLKISSSDSDDDEALAVLAQKQRRALQAATGQGSRRLPVPMVSVLIAPHSKPLPVVVRGAY